MISFNDTIWNQRMHRFIFLLPFTLVLTQGKLVAQESAAGGQATPPTSTQPSGPLAPPPDNAAPATPPAAATTTTTTTTTTKSETTKATISATTPQDIARIQQQEIIRRQELIFRANQALAAAQSAEKGQNYPEARKNYLFAAEAFGSISRSTTSYAQAAEGLTRVDLKLYDDALTIGDTRRAKLLIDEVVKYNPNNKVANEKLVAINEMIANPNDTSLYGNPAVNPAFVKKVNEVQQLFIEAEQFRRTGQWDQAEGRLKHILGIDPYNIGATRELERIDAEKNQYADTARLENRTERLREVEEKWYEPIVNKEAGINPQDSQLPITGKSNFDLDRKLKEIFVSIHFDNGTTIEDATNSLSIESKRLDPEHKGINFIIQPSAASSNSSTKPISLTLNNVPLEEALRYVCQIANVKYKVQDYAISIVPFNASTEDLLSRTFIVQPSFVVPPSTATASTGLSSGIGGARPLPPVAGALPAASTGSGDTVRDALEAKGVKFPPGASAIYNPDTNELKVLNTADMIELIEALATAGQAPTFMVKIAAKFVEINQDDLNDLTINSAFNLFNPLTQTAISGPVSRNILTTSHYSTQLSGSRAFSANSIDQLINPQTQNFNSIYLRGMFEGAQYNIVIDALSQKKSYDLLSEPFTLAKSGETAEVKAVRSFPYPTAFTEPELVTQSNNNSTSLVAIVNPPVVIATTPTEFNRKDVGVYLGITPQVGADNKTINLSLRPIVTDFQGFINYGSPIFVGNPDGTQSLLSTNDINQPVFNTRRINTKVLIRDGSTVVLGGLVREDMQSVNDKVPILGDLPLIGRLFQSKATKSTKRNLIIFVTANIYRNDGELLNPPDDVNAAAILTSRAGNTPPAAP